MNFKNQTDALNQLETLAKHDIHSIIIEGVAGCGKTHIASSYAGYLHIPNTQVIQPNVNDVRDCIENCETISEKILIILENADSGVPAVFSTMLKFLEEPIQNVYIIVTCRNIQFVPDTIISRCSVVSVVNPTSDDINLYAENKDHTRYIALSKLKLWSIIRSFKEVDYLFSLNPENVDYLENTSIEWLKKLPVTNSVWRLNHYADNSTFPPEYSVRMILSQTNDPIVRYFCLTCIDNLMKTNIAPHTTLAKFVFDIKYLT